VSRVGAATQANATSVTMDALIVCCNGHPLGVALEARKFALRDRSMSYTAKLKRAEKDTRLRRVR